MYFILRNLVFGKSEHVFSWNPKYDHFDQEIKKKPCMLFTNGQVKNKQNQF